MSPGSAAEALTASPTSTSGVVSGPNQIGRPWVRSVTWKARHGLSAGGIALGYRRKALYDPARLDRDGQPRRLGVRWVVEPAEAETVRTIFRWYAEDRGLHVVAGLLNARGVPSPRQAKGHRDRQGGVGAGWDASAVRVILGNELYRERLIWNRSQWVRVPGSRRRRGVMRPESDWVVVERPELCIVDEALWARVEERRRQVRATFAASGQFGQAKTEYGTYLLSGRLVCGECRGLLSIRTGRPQRYGCTRRWRRGPTACPNTLLVRRDVAEMRVLELLRTRLYTQEGVAQLVEAVNGRLRARQPALTAERTRLQRELHDVHQRFEGVRRFIEQGEGSAKVRQWLAELERDEARLNGALASIEAEADQPPPRVHPRKVQTYLADLHATLAKGGSPARQVVQEDVQQVVVHPMRPKAAKPFARAEVITSGEGLLGRVALVVAGGRSAFTATAQLDLCFVVIV